MCGSGEVGCGGTDGGVVLSGVGVKRGKVVGVASGWRMVVSGLL